MGSGWNGTVALSEIKGEGANLEGELTSSARLLFRARHESSPCDQGDIPPWILRQSAPPGKPRGTNRQFLFIGFLGEDQNKPRSFRAIRRMAAIRTIRMNFSPFLTEILAAHQPPSPMPKARIKPYFHSTFPVNTKMRNAGMV